MKKIAKLIAGVSAVSLLAASFAGCGKDESTTQTQPLKYWTVMDAASAQTLTSYSEMLLYREMEKATGIKVEFIHPIAGSTGSEAFNTMLASGELPDMIEHDWSNYAGGAEAAIEDGVIIALNDYLEEYAPNYHSYVAGEKNKANNNLYKAETMTDSGKYYGFRSLSIGNCRGFAGLILRADLLRKWGMEVPETIDDWEKVFAKAKQEGYTKPFTCYSNPLSISKGNHTFNTAYDVGKVTYVEDGKVVHALLQPGYREFTAKLAEWVQKGYIDRNFVTNASTDCEGNMTQEGVSVATFGWIGSLMGKLLPAMEERNPEYDLVACPYPVMNKGDKCEWQEYQGEARRPEIAVTTDCSDIKSAMNWCDYLYSDEGSTLRTFGIEGDTYTIEEIDGEKHFIYTDKIQKPETSGTSSVNAALYKFFRPANAPGLNQHPDYLNGYYTYQSQKDALVTWNANIEGAKEHALPSLTYTTEESAEMAALNQQYASATDTAINEIIMGNRSIDEFDTIASDAEKNYLGRIVEIQNAAYQRYLKKLEN